MWIFARWRRCAWCRKESATRWDPTVLWPGRKISFCSQRCVDAYLDDEGKRLEAERLRSNSHAAWQEVDRYGPDSGGGDSGGR